MPSVSVNISDPKNFPFGLIFFWTRNEKLSMPLFLISPAPLIFCQGQDYPSQCVCAGLGNEVLVLVTLLSRNRNSLQLEATRINP